MDTLIQHRLRGGRVLDDTTFMETTLGRIPLGSVQPAWFVFSPGFNRGWLYLGAKRAVEVVLALSVLAVSLPVWALLAALIKLDSPGPVIFKQRRVGADGREFEVLKFRSMRRAAEASGARWASADDARITRVGRVIRALRLDELPQLWNILRGDMSLVGPRPERPEFVSWLAKEIPYYATRHRVKPGLTGWAQINYRYGASLDDARVKLEYDLYYIKHMAFFLDLFIIVKTAKTVLFDRSGR